MPHNSKLLKKKQPSIDNGRGGQSLGNRLSSVPAVPRRGFVRRARDQISHQPPRLLPSNRQHFKPANRVAVFKPHPEALPFRFDQSLLEI